MLETLRRSVLWVALAGLLGAGGCIIVADDDGGGGGGSTYGPYEGCSGAGTCSWGECYTITYRDTSGLVGSGNMCTSTCSVQEDCWGDGLCLSIEGMPRYLCYPQCDYDSDCPFDFVCEDVDVEGVLYSVCLPAR